MNSYDVIILGSGPAGLTAAIYASRDNLKTLLIGGRRWGGQLMLTTTVDNYPGFESGIQGPELMEKMKTQAGRFGAELKLVDATKVDFRSVPFSVATDENETFQSRSVIIATGADTMWLGLPNEQRLIGKGVSSCAPCDAFFFKGKKVIVVGGGDSAMEEALVLSKFATEITIVHRREAFRASKIMQERVLKLPNVKVIYNTQVTDILGQDHVEGVVLNAKDHFPCDGVFIAIGHIPNTKLFAGQLELDAKGYLKKEQKIPGIFVAGDVHDFHYKQAITAAALGCQAAMDAGKYLNTLSV